MPEIVAPEMLVVFVPVFVTLTLWVALLPMGTSPKLMLFGVAERTSRAGAGVFALVMPAQPDRQRTAGAAAKISRSTNSLGTRYLIPLTGHTCRSLVSRTYISWLKAASAQEPTEEVACCLVRPKFLFSDLLSA